MQNDRVTTVVEFLQTGLLGPIRLGLSISECEALLGAPEAVGGNPKTRIHQWGVLELSYSDDRVWLIQLELWDTGRSSPARLPLADLDEFLGASLESFENITHQNGIETEADRHHPEVNRKADTSGAVAVFGDDGTLDSITIHSSPPSA